MDERNLTPVTYYPLPLQQQFGANVTAIREKPYAPYLSPDLTVPLSAARLLQHGPLSPELTSAPDAEGIEAMISKTASFPEAGYALLEGPTSYSQSRILMPEVTVEMMKWWFTWHPLESERYLLWFPYAHVGTSIEDPKRLADPSLTFEERFYNNPDSITEYIGPSKLDLIIDFKDPVELGADAASLRREGFTFSASGMLRVATAPDTLFALMMHLGRQTPAGFEFVSRYWIGAHPELRRFESADKTPDLLRKMSLTPEAVLLLASEMSVHDMTEYNHLAKVLPVLYAKFGT